MCNGCPIEMICDPDPNPDCAAYDKDNMCNHVIPSLAAKIQSDCPILCNGCPDPDATTATSTSTSTSTTRCPPDSNEVCAGYSEDLCTNPVLGAMVQGQCPILCGGCSDEEEDGEVTCDPDTDSRCADYEPAFCTNAILSAIVQEQCPILCGGCPG